MIKHSKRIENGVYCIANYLTDNGQFFTIPEFNARYGLTVDFWTFNGCIILFDETVYQEAEHSC